MTKLDQAAATVGAPDVLRALVNRSGPAVLTERRRVLGALADAMPENRRERHILAAALDEGIPARLTAGATGPADVERESQRLSDSHGLSPDLARWAVSVLAQAIAPRPGAENAPSAAPLASASPAAIEPAHGPAAVPHKHARFWRFVRIGGPIIIVILGLLRLLASLPS